MEMSKAVGYVRLSVDDKRNPSQSPENQKSIIKNQAEINDDKILEFYEDINRTGSNIFRPALMKLMEDAKQKKFSKVYIKDWSRFSRNLSDQETMLKDLKKLGIEVYPCEGSTDKKARQITGLTNEWYYDDFREKAEMNIKLKLHNKIPITRAPIGYKINKKTKKWLIDKKKAPIIKKIFDLRTENRTIGEIAKEVKMSSVSIYRILENRAYLGEYRYRNVVYYGWHDPIIDEQTFDKAQNKLNAGGWKYGDLEITA